MVNKKILFETEDCSFYIPTNEELYYITPLNKKMIDIRYIPSLIEEEDFSWKTLCKNINPIYQEQAEQLILNIITFDMFKTLVNKNKVISSIKDIITIAQEESNDNEREFISHITKTERQVLSNIMHLEFNNQKEGYIIVNQLINKYKVSTPVFRSLLYKLKEFKVAEVITRGVKGTYICFYNFNILVNLVDNF
jgi:ribosomal protein L17